MAGCKCSCHVFVAYQVQCGLLSAFPVGEFHVSLLIPYFMPSHPQYFGAVQPHTPPLKVLPKGLLNSLAANAEDAVEGLNPRHDDDNIKDIDIMSDQLFQEQNTIGQQFIMR